MTSPNDPNREDVIEVARALGDLRDSVVFVGGCAAGLLVTEWHGQTIRATPDVDVVVQAESAQDYHAVEALLEERGFVHDIRAGAPICRWRYHSIAVDVMPSEQGVLSAANPWYPLVPETAQQLVLVEGLAVRLIAAPLFIATKFEAIRRRWKGDLLGGHDLRDIVAVVDGRASLPEEVRQAPEKVREFVVSNFGELLARPAFPDVLAGLLQDDTVGRQRLPELRARLRELAELK
ncbi:MAG: hypothetical protein KKH12_09995 [Gammaproteobacteria bacterium]|nr:hypothetical protein [Gammaproteobacteria bacterium]MBU1481994.1 hypothetical protein [Gammaproteobacteria bacterium]